MSEIRQQESRQSSILKPPKPRNPLSDVQLVAAPDTTLWKSRRVSFANVHVKKEFTADPEKNTIWHNSYEEEMNKSDFSEGKKPDNVEDDVNMSVENMYLDSDVMNCTQMVNFEESFEAVLGSNSADTSITSATIDLTTFHNKKAPVLASVQTHSHFKEVAQQSVYLSDEMECTFPIPAIINLQQNTKRKSVNFNTKMDITQVVSLDNKENKNTTTRQTIHCNEDMEDATIETKHSVPPHVLLYLRKNHQTQNRELENSEMDVTQAVTHDYIESIMEFTQNVPPQMLLNLNKMHHPQQRQTILPQSVVIDKENKISTKRQTIYFNSENKTEGDAMEFTQNVPAQTLLNLDKMHGTQQSQTLHPQNVEIDKDNKVSKKRQTIYFNTEIETEDDAIEFTQNVSPQMVLNINKIHQTHQRQTIHPQSIEIGKDNKVSTKRQTINFNIETETEGAAMEFTQNVPPQQRQTIHSQRVVTDKKNKVATKRQTINFNTETEGATMEFTQNVPAQMLLNQNKMHQAQQKLTILPQSVEIDKENKVSTKRQTININKETETGNTTMDFTQNVPPQQRQTNHPQIIVTDKENKLATKRHTINFNTETEGATMEFTENVPAQMFLNQNKMHQAQQKQTILPQSIKIDKENKVSTKRQTININKETETENTTMDFTQNVTPQQRQTYHPQIVVTDKENKLATKRHTINFNTETEGATMEFTQNVPTQMLLNQNKMHQTQQRQTIHPQNVEIDKDNKVSKKRQTIYFNTEIETEDDAIEFTQNVSPQMVLNINKIHQTQHSQTIHPQSIEIGKDNKVSTKRQTINFNTETETEGAAMEFTQNVPPQQRQTIHPQSVVTDKENKLATKRQTINFKTETEGATMEFTQNVPAQTLLNQNKMHQAQQKQTILPQSVKIAKENKVSTKRQTINIVKETETEDTTMDFTQNVPPQQRQTIHPQNVVTDKENKLATKRHTINFNTETEGATMEFTQNVPAQMLLNQNKMHQTQQKQTILPQSVKIDKENKVSAKRQTININKETETENTTMDFTQNVPPQQRQTIHPQSVVTDKEIKLATKRHTINFNTETEGATMEFTQNVPAQMLLNRNKMHQTQQSQTIHPQSIKIGKDNKVSTKRQTINFNTGPETEGAAMEFTQNVPPQQKQTIHPQFVVTDTENKVATKRQTINFNTEIEGATMEFTQNVPAQMLLNQNKMHQVQQKQRILPQRAEVDKENKVSTKRQRIDINKETETEDITMEFTQNLLPQQRQTIHPQSVETEKENNISTKRQTIKFNTEIESESNTMELVQNISPQMLLNINKMQQRQTIHPQSVEIDKDNKLATQRQTINYNTETDTKDATMELTQNVLQQMLLNINEIHQTHKNQIIHPQSVEIGYKENKSVKKRQTIDFRTEIESEGATMEVAQNGLPQMLLNLNKKHPEKCRMKTDEVYFPDQSVADVGNIHNNELLRHKGQPLILCPHVEEEQNSSDICQRIRFPGQKDDFNVSKINLDLTPVNNPNSFNFTANTTSLTDSTEKLINCNIALPSSEYSKIIFDAIDKNYSIANTSYPSDIDNCDTIENKKDSIISINSSAEINKSIEIRNTTNEYQIMKQEVQNILSRIKPVKPYYFNTEFSSDAKTTSSEDDNAIIRLKKLNWDLDLSFKGRVKKYYNIDLDELKHNKIDTTSLNIRQQEFSLVLEESKEKHTKLMEYTQKQTRDLRKEQSKELSLMDRIKQMINKDTAWKIIPDEKFSFTFMKNTTKLTAKVDEELAVVEKIEFFHQLNETKSHPIALYIDPIKKLKLSESQINSAIGQSYTIFTLLDYVTKIGNELWAILEEFHYLEMEIGLILDRELNATMEFRNMHLLVVFQVTFNLNNLESMSGESISVKNIVGTVDECALRRLVKVCPSGFVFFRKYDRMVKDYLKLLQHSRKK